MATQLNDGAARYDVDDAADFDAADLEVGDRIDPVLVSSTLDGVDAEIYTGGGVAQSDAPRTQLACLTATDRMDGVLTAILTDGESGVMVRASRHEPQTAWTQKEARHTPSRARLADTGFNVRRGSSDCHRPHE